MGAGGLALGAARAGFEHVTVLDWNGNACKTLGRNKSRGVEHVSDWMIVEDDVREHDFKRYENKIEVVFGGPPCQPFSIGGKHLGHVDERNMFPEAVRAIRDIQPKAFVFLKLIKMAPKLHLEPCPRSKSEINHASWVRRASRGVRVIERNAAARVST